MNGERITKGELAPYINNPDNLLYYGEYDIAERFNKGKDAVAGLILPP